MSLRCSFVKCSSFELARADQLAFYQDINNGGWCLGLGPEFKLSESTLPPNIRLVETGDDKFPYNAMCNQCLSKVGKVNLISGFNESTVNFSAKKVLLLQSRDSVERHAAASSQKWAKVVNNFPQIRKITASIPQGVQLTGSNTVHFHGAGDLQDMIEAGSLVAAKSNLSPRRYQWRAYFFGCFNNSLLCLPTGMGKTLIANMLMKAYHQRNPNQGQVFIVPTIVLVEQQAAAIEQTTGLKVKRRSGEHERVGLWSASEICVCTHAMLLNAIKMKRIDMSQLSLVVLDEVHEANSANSQYGLLLPFILKCPASQRPRVLGLTASPSGTNSTDMRQDITTLCNKVNALPYTPLVGDDKNTDKANDVTCNYIPIHKSSFEVRFETFVLESLESFAGFHTFFEGSWKKLHANLSTRVKIDAAIKALSHASLVAQNQGDLPLRQLTSWMLKWIDSLDMLQIFGPRKLIGYIRVDLEFANSNDALSTISTLLGPLLAQMRLTINRMELEYQIAVDSPRVAELLSHIKRHKTDQERILIFVDRRNTAERLCRRLKEDSDVGQMNPDYVIGNSNGGFPREVQQAVLKTFDEGTCQVLVATSVLEQGIDVAACGVVICFDGVKSMKSIIQSRGRARKKSAKFIAFIDADKQRKTNDLSTMEISMNYAIAQLMRENKSAFDPQIVQMIDKFLESDRENVEGLADSNEVEDEFEDEASAELPSNKNHFQLRFFNYVDAQALSDHIRFYFTSNFDSLKVSKKFIWAQFAVSVNDVREGLNIIKNISTTPDKTSASSLRTWIEVVSFSTENETALQPFALAFNCLTGFYFKDCITVNFDYESIWENFVLEIQSNQIILKRNSEHFVIHPIDVDGQILINDNNNSLEVYFCLRNPPSYFRMNDRAHFSFAGKSFNLCIKRCSPIDATVSFKLRNALQSFSLQVYNVCNLRHKSFEDDSAIEMSHVKASEWFMRSYLIEAWHSKHSHVLPPELPKRVLAKFQACSTITTLELLLSNTIPVRFQKLQIEYLKEVKLPFGDCDPPTSYAMFGRVKITPSRMIFMPLQPLPKNRVFRYFPNPENFLLISFTDEHDGNPWRSMDVCAWFLNVMKKGFTVGNKTFTFLGCSNSQLREGHCWFSCLDREEIYNKIGDFPNMNAGRKLTRLALAFASSVTTVPLNHDLYLKHVSPDVELGGVNFSDGIGRGSFILFDKVRTIMNLPQKISALQIRVGGVKGVISLYDELESYVTFRKSMKKFESRHNMLEVLNFSSSIELFLNRHVILLLSSFGVSDDVFLQLQHNELAKCMDALMHDNQMLAFVKSRSKIFDWERFPSAQLVQEPFFRQMLVSNAIQLISGIINHARILVPKGRVLMGVLDETGTLEYGEVYAHVVEDDLDFEIEGRVLVFRNPCVLPSDVRVLNACKKTFSPRLKQLYQNCLVIPSRGPDSHARECSGGDLDGDLYYVIWDQDVVPPRLKIPGEKVVEVETKEMASLDCDNSADAMMQFYCDYVSKNQLGIIANAHLAIADKLGMRHPQSIELARYVAAETDAPKKGFTVGKVDQKLLPTEYPDFMQKPDKQSYRSETILGELFRQAHPLLDVLYEKRIIVSPRAVVNLSGVLHNIEGFYSLYSFEIKKLLQSFELESEVDLFSGTPIWRKGYMSEFKKQNQLRLTVAENVAEFWKKWQGIFENWRSEVANDKAKVNEWYRRPHSSQEPVHSFSFLAMPYVDFEENARISISEAIHVSAYRWVIHNKMKWLGEWRLRYQVGQTIMRKLDGIDCHFYGSSMLGLNEEYSDVDLYVADNSFEDLGKRLKVLDDNVSSMKKPHACVSLTYESLPVDVTNFAGGVYKTYAIAEAFDENPGYWPALRVLIEWARTVRIVKSGGSQGIMTVVSFIHLFIHVVSKAPPRNTDSQTEYSLARLGSWMESLKASKCGNFIYDFLKFISNRQNRAWIITKTDPLNGETLIKSGLVGELSKYAEIALYILAIHDGDVQKLFQFCTKSRLFKIDKRYMNPTKLTDGAKNNCFKEIKAKCNPSKDPQLMFQLLERNGVFYLEANGDHKHFSDVQQGLNKIHGRILSVRMSGLRKLNCYHVANSTFIIPEFGHGPSTEVSFKTYQGENFMAQHTGIWKSVLTFRNCQKNLSWRSSEYQRYAERFIKQFEMFRNKQRLHQKGSKTCRFFGDLMCNIRCGTHYLFNIPETLNNTFESISLRQVEANISKHEETLSLERQENIIVELKNYNSLTLIQSKQELLTKEAKAPLELMPLNEVKMRSGQKKIAQVTAAPPRKSNGIRHSYYPQWTHGVHRARQFASTNGFVEVQTQLDDQYTTLSVYWRQRELVVNCDFQGLINNIRHRSTRWLSMTIKRFEDGSGDDIRTYLECRAALDDDESCLETIIDYLNGRSVFTEKFMEQIHQNDQNETLPTQPLIPEMFHLNWRFRTMRQIKPVAKFVNADNDTLLLNEIHDGVFQLNTRVFDWYTKHYELEIKVCMDNRSDMELCKKSYEMSLQLFDATKRSISN